MGVLSRILKTPDEDESEDEFQAEESGLLMAASTAKESPTETPPVPELEGQEGWPTEAVAEAAAEGELEAEPTEGEEPSPEAAENAQAEEPEGQSEPSSDEDSADDPLSAFRSTIGKRDRARALEQDLPDVPAQELLAEARSILGIIAARPNVQAPEEAEREAA
jgi:hypothetical protein